MGFVVSGRAKKVLVEWDLPEEEALQAEGESLAMEAEKGGIRTLLSVCPFLAVAWRVAVFPPEHPRKAVDRAGPAGDNLSPGGAADPCPLHPRPARPVRLSGHPGGSPREGQAVFGRDGRPYKSPSQRLTCQTPRTMRAAPETTEAVIGSPSPRTATAVAAAGFRYISTPTLAAGRTLRASYQKT